MSSFMKNHKIWTGIIVVLLLGVVANLGGTDNNIEKSKAPQSSEPKKEDKKSLAWKKVNDDIKEVNQKSIPIADDQTQVQSDLATLNIDTGVRGEKYAELALKAGIKPETVKNQTIESHYNPKYNTPEDMKKHVEHAKNTNSGYAMSLDDFNNAYKKVITNGNRD